MSDPNFQQRRENAIQRINSQDAEILRENPHRDAFFETVYNAADGDAALVPWADLEPKTHLLCWLQSHPGNGASAIDVGCGLGDNAEAISDHGYRTTAFDFSEPAIEWAKQRFPNTDVSYQSADLFNLPEEWNGKFDLVHECYTLQSVPPETLDQSIPAVASLVAPGGTLLVYARIRDNGSAVDGPPWPIEEQYISSFTDLGFTMEIEERFFFEKGDRQIPHIFTVWRNCR